MNKYFAIDLRKPNDWRDGAANVAVWNDWDRAWRKKLGWRAGLRFFSRTNVPRSWTLVSRHWPHRLCWQWSISFSMPRPGYDTGPNSSVRFSRYYRFGFIRIFNHELRLSWQNYDWMVACGQPYNVDAPQLYWRHHLENAEPLGTA